MQCPACGNRLEEMTIGDVTVDVCRRGCGGVWFDRFELQKCDEQHEAAGEALLEIERDPTLVVDHDKRRNCPRCEDIVMMRHFFSVQRGVEVDECPQCAGVWLDQGELGAIRHAFATEAERQRAARECFADLFDGELARMRRENEQQRERAHKAARALRFICPSYWMPGKQEWGAF